MTVAKEPIAAWWFARDDGILPHGDGRPIVLGERYSVKGRLVICENGLHGSRQPLDALKYAPGPILYRTLHSGTIIEEDDKLCSRYRVHVEKRDATATLRLFARSQALSVIDLWDAPEIMRRYLETGDETIRVAAEAAVGAAIWAEAGDAACYAACSAAGDASWAAAWDAAGDASWAAAWDAARNEAWSAARTRTAAGDEAWSVAWSAAWSAARSAARSAFNTLVNDLFAT